MQKMRFTSFPIPFMYTQKQGCARRKLQLAAAYRCIALKFSSFKTVRGDFYAAGKSKCL